MYVILFYDIAGSEQKEKNNANRIRKAVEKYLPRVQFSVFEGEIRQSDFKRLTATLQKECDKELDSIVIYTFNSLKYSERLVIGQDKNGSLFS
ncbi:CRISPR-associated endonuclease Cas2 [Campylobacter sp. RM9344]|uniref:CRISPR-associated endoribonuclease Cas2 n=1 Tax=Campylobacter californiensis TaxID=1032243 RepID=A0AAW3ZYC8_9BACT|nr:MULTISPECIES: CRISPR-associated endonuclease Cas2 [unclassified Campylobacter]MBE2985016.1 CRISPR-associated endonuclease Cas2 [Campylobacter sp. RM6883]MBE2995212.1 CRISPR-associated endonuclease Cas2 [Campylobacter sp. RM6913]MBE3029531.1 CRISPR-associated endonuclease Cas2 [Campylobacter sp. RM9344]MBE3608205.1 CRISPR-associated endonuclease Cas2 [Campylobacter sp. RM9337]QCD51625.1 CRISPR/Cas system-associated endoribonuclease Cas2, type I-B/HMARI [Campylobacter sp. RM6914]